MIDESGRDPEDIEKTDELPVLSEEAILAAGGEIPTLEDEAEDTVEHVVEPLRQAQESLARASDETGQQLAKPFNELERDLAELRSKWGSVESTLATNSLAIRELQKELSASREELRNSQAQQQRLVAELAGRAAAPSTAGADDAAAAARAETRMREAEAAADRGSARVAELENALAEAKAELTELRSGQAHAEQRAAELDAAVATERQQAAERARERDELRKALQELREQSAKQNDADGRLRPHLERIASLETYIAGRADRWTEMEATVAASKARVQELERELAQRVEREQNLEQRLHDEQQSAQALRQKLTESNRRTLELEAALAAYETDQREPVPESSPASNELLLELQEEIVDHQQLIARQEQALREREAENERLKARIAESERRENEAQRELGRLSREIEAEIRHEPGSGHTGPEEDMRSPELICLTSETPERYVLDRARMTIGRGNGCDIRIPTHFVSREHAVLRRIDEKIVVEDLDSTNGVFVNAVRVDRKPLQHGDWLTIGETQFRYLDERERRAD